MGRNIEVTINGAMPLDGQRAALKRVEEYENAIARGETLAPISSVAADPAVKQVCTGNEPYVTYVFDLSDFDPTLGDYVLDLVEIGPS